MSTAPTSATNITLYESYVGQYDHHVPAPPLRRSAPIASGGWSMCSMPDSHVGDDPLERFQRIPSRCPLAKIVPPRRSAPIVRRMVDVLYADPAVRAILWNDFSDSISAPTGKIVGFRSAAGYDEFEHGQR